MAPSAEVFSSATAMYSTRLRDDDTSMPDSNHGTFEPKDRVEPIPKTDFPHQLYPMSIGHKFEPDGRVLPFPGNTIICHLSPDSELFRALLGLRDALKSQDFASLYVLLPPTSWHMTVFEGVTDQIRKSSSWPADLALDAPLDSCTALVKEKLANFDLGTEPPFHMVVKGYQPLTEGIALKVVPATAAEEKRLRALRDCLSERLQMRPPGHDTYSFHIGLAYLLRRLDREQHQKLSDFLQAYRSKLPYRFDLRAPEFCIFDDMFAFHRQSFLSSQSNVAGEVQL